MCQVNPETGKYEKNASCQSCPSPGKPNEDNWVWSPQCDSELSYQWISHPSTETRSEIAMHLPERWGILQFEDSLENGASYYQDGGSEKSTILHSLNREGGNRIVSASESGNRLYKRLCN